MTNVMSLSKNFCGSLRTESIKKHTPSSVKKLSSTGLIVPEGCVELSNEEMEYLNGGFTLYTWMVSAPIDIALMAIGATAICGGIKLVGKYFGKSMAKKFSLKMAPIIAKLLGTLSGAALNICIGKLGQILTGAFWNFTSLGGIVAFALDIIIDGEYNGVIATW